MSFDWNAVWERKASGSSTIHKEVSGFEHLEIDSEETARNLKKILQITSEDLVLEVGCAAGIVAQHLDLGPKYIGIDKCAAMVKKSIEMNDVSALCCDADDLIFKDKSFDKSFSFAVFHYFPDHEYAWKAVAEMKRVTRSTMLLAYLPRKSHDDNHLLFTEEMFLERGWKLSEPIFHHPDRFDVILEL